MNSSNRQLLNPHRRLRAGCYGMWFSPTNPYWGPADNPSDAELGIEEYVGSLRVVHYTNDGTRALGLENVSAGQPGLVVYVSGDLYAHRPNSGAKFGNDVPTFASKDYRFYLLATDIQETSGGRFLLTFESTEYVGNGWVSRGRMTAHLSWAEAPSDVQSPYDYLEGEVFDDNGVEAGELRLAWLCPHIRRAVIEVDRVNQVSLPLDNFSRAASGFEPEKEERRDWADVFNECGWKVVVLESDQPAEPASKIWREYELHSALPALRDAVTEDGSWRYHIFCVGRLDDSGRGYQFSTKGIEKNSSLFESVVIAARYAFPRLLKGASGREEWGTIAGQLLEDTPCYFRTAVHELGHAIGLEHNFTTLGFMATTDAIQQAALQLANQNTRTEEINVLSHIDWSFAPDDLERLRHWPDIVLRPGDKAPKLPLPGIDEFRFVPLQGGAASSDERAPELELDVRAFQLDVPIGAPARIDLSLTNVGKVPVYVPALRLKAGHLSGKVEQPSGEVRTFGPVANTIDELGFKQLEPGRIIRGSMTVIRGPEGALFPSPGVHTVTVELMVYRDRQFFSYTKSITLNVTPFVDAKHLRVARLVLDTTDALLTFAVGGDGLADGNQAINLALNDSVLGPHYVVVRLKQLARGIGKVRGSLDEALRVLGSKNPPVLTPTELSGLIRSACSAINVDGDAFDSAELSTFSSFAPSRYLLADLRCVALRIVLGKLNQATLKLFLSLIRPDSPAQQAQQTQHPQGSAANAYSVWNGMPRNLGFENLLREKLGLSAQDSAELAQLLLSQDDSILGAIEKYSSSGDPKLQGELADAVQKIGFGTDLLKRIVVQFKSLERFEPKFGSDQFLLLISKALLDVFTVTPIQKREVHEAFVANLNENLLKAGLPLA